MLPLKRGSVVAIGVAFAVLAIVEYFYLPNRAQAMQFEALRAKAVALSELTAYGAVSSLEFEAEDAANEQLEGPARDPELASITIYTSKGEAFASFRRSGVSAAPAPAIPSRTETLQLPRSLRVVTPVPLRSGPPGVLVADFSTAAIEAAGAKNRRVAGVIAIAIVGLGILLVIWIRRALSRIETLLEENSLARQRAEAANQAKSEFLANTSHEIRTPLNAVLGTVEVLLAQDLGTKQRRLSETIRHSGEVLLALLDDILDFSRIESGRLKLEVVPIDVPSLLDSVVDRFLARAESKQIELDLQSEGIPRTVLGDRHRIGQVLGNLIGNAVKFTDRGRVEVRVEEVARVEDRAVLRFSVKDTGIGIAPEARGRIGRPFSQGDSSTTRVYGGSGLGLAISRRLVFLMGGDIQMESEKGRGSHFWFDLEMAVVPDSERAEPELPSTPQPVRALRVFAAEDNEANQEVLRAMLELIGCELTIVDNGRAAVDELKKSQPDYDLVLMDCQMPVLDGYHATSEIREHETQNGWPRIPIVAVTAHAYSGERAKVLAAGMDDYLTKPLSMNALRETLVRWSPMASFLPTPLKAASEAPVVLEHETIEQLRSYCTPKKPTFFMDVVGKYIRSAESCTQSIRVAFEAGDMIGVKKNAHALKGSSRTMGAIEVGKLAEDLEAFDSHTEPAVATVLEELEAAVGRAIRALNQAAAA